MDIKAILKARNLSDEDITALTTKPEYASILEALVKEAEDGKTAFQKAQEIEQNLKTWNETQVVPYVRKADEEKAAIAGKLAQTQAHLKALKDAGYDIPDSYLESSPSLTPAKVEPVTTSGLTKEDFDKFAYEKARTDMSLITLSNKHRKLTGDELDLDAEFPKFEANRRPNENLRDYIARTYDHAGLEAKRSQEAEQKKLDDYAAKKVSEEKAKWTQSNGPNPETRNPKSSKFDEISKQEGRAQLWQTREGRDKLTKARLEKYTSLIQQ